MFYYPYEQSFLQRLNGKISKSPTLEHMVSNLHLPEFLSKLCIESSNIILNDLKHISNETVYYFCPTEPLPFVTPDFMEHANKLCKTNNNHFYIVHNNLLDDLENYYGTFSHIHFINNMILNVGRAYVESLQYIKMDKTYDFDKAYINLNNKGRYNRYLLIDEIYKHGLESHGYISWDSKQSTEDLLHYSIDYKLQYFNGKRIQLDNNINYLDESINSRGLINICSEVQEYWFYVKNISEKTMYALMTEKPFVVIGGQNNNTVYKDYGFEIYDELFDYTFDANDSLEQRIKGVVQNLKYISQQDYNKLYNSVRDKTIHNKKQFLQLVQKQLEYSKDLISLLSKDSDHPDMIKHKGYYNGVIQLLEN